jgi:hypothetical protein
MYIGLMTEYFSLSGYTPIINDLLIINVKGLLISGLRSLGVTFPPHDSSDAGSNLAEVFEFLRMEKFREQVLREGLQAV